jgi:hypothetical protein
MILRADESVTRSPTVVFLEPVYWIKRPVGTVADTTGDLDAINARFDGNEFLRLAELNTLRLMGKPRL